MMGHWGLIQPGHHLILGQGLEAGRFEVEATGSQCRAVVRWYELAVEVRSNREFCVG